MNKIKEILKLYDNLLSKIEKELFGTILVLLSLIMLLSSLNENCNIFYLSLGSTLTIYGVIAYIISIRKV